MTSNRAKLLKKTLVGALIGLSVGVSLPLSASEPAMVEIPVEGGLFMRETDSGQTIIISGDGRFVLPGRLVDRSDGHTMVTNLDQAREAFANQSIAASQAPGSNSSMINVNEVLSFTVGGEAEKEVFVFVDPTCPHCHTVMNMQEELTGEYTFHNVLIPVLGENATEMVDRLSCMSEEDRMAAVMTQDMGAGDITSNCAYDQMRNSRSVAQRLSISAVPVLISHNGHQASGAPQTVQQLVRFLEGDGQ